VTSEPTNERVRRCFERSAPTYDRSIAIADRFLKIDRGRAWLARRAVGEILEIGVGTGQNLAFYPPDVAVTGIDLSQAMLDRARSRASTLGRPADLDVGDAQALAFPDGRFDTVVFSLCLCTIPDHRRALVEGLRVTRPGGRVLTLEHVRSPRPIVAIGQRLVEPLLVRAHADHLTRDPLDDLAGLGARVDEVDRWAWGIMQCTSSRAPGATA